MYSKFMMHGQKNKFWPCILNIKVFLKTLFLHSLLSKNVNLHYERSALLYLNLLVWHMCSSSTYRPRHFRNSQRSYWRSKLFWDYFNTCTVHLLLFCAVTNQCTINWQFIILLLHISTLLCHPQGARS